ncbi:hypothetical protein [Actinoallomurus acaciae]|uniref:Uncharacterized protein n=1 Tax=Actinoallomurus acaciae TaxID=502577 RepID=A0ABV5YE60_9ACTN
MNTLLRTTATAVSTGPFAQEHLAYLDHAGDRLRGRAIEYRAPHYGADGQITQVFVLGTLGWPTIWRLPPPQNIDRHRGRPVRRLTRPWGAFELRDDGAEWRIFWLDRRHEDAWAASRAYSSAAEAAAELAFIEASHRAHPPTGVHHAGAR